MTIIILLIGFSLTIASGFLVALLCSIKAGQFDDTHSPAVRMLFDNNPQPTKDDAVHRKGKGFGNGGNPHHKTRRPKTGDKSHGSC
jgi:cbb3-type cytochrome oxidase maturation protein